MEFGAGNYVRSEKKLITDKTGGQKLYFKSELMIKCLSICKARASSSEAAVGGGDVLIRDPDMRGEADVWIEDR